MSQYDLRQFNVYGGGGDDKNGYHRPRRPFPFWFFFPPYYAPYPPYFPPYYPPTPPYYPPYRPPYYWGY